MLDTPKINVVAQKLIRQKLTVSSTAETVQHYLLACPIYEDQRDILQQRLIAAVGVPYLDLEPMLNTKPDDEFKTDRTYILSELETFITNSERFMVLNNRTSPRLSTRIPGRLYT